MYPTRPADRQQHAGVAPAQAPPAEPAGADPRPSSRPRGARAPRRPGPTTTASPRAGCRWPAAPASPPGPCGPARTPGTPAGRRARTARRRRRRRRGSRRRGTAARHAWRWRPACGVSRSRHQRWKATSAPAPQAIVTRMPAMLDVVDDPADAPHRQRVHREEGDARLLAGDVPVAAAWRCRVPGAVVVQPPVPEPRPGEGELHHGRGLGVAGLDLPVHDEQDGEHTPVEQERRRPHGPARPRRIVGPRLAGGRTRAHVVARFDLGRHRRHVTCPGGAAGHRGAVADGGRLRFPATRWRPPAPACAGPGRRAGSRSCGRRRSRRPGPRPRPPRTPR